MEVILVRHGETQWSRSGRHTGRTDVPLTDTGRQQARRLATRLAGHPVDIVWSSPLSRATETCRLAGLGDRARLRDDLLEWDYGDYEGVTTAQIRGDRPGWLLWRDGCPHGEDATQVAARVDRVIAELRDLRQDAALFAHGHVLRVLAARWLGLGPASGALLALSTASVSALGYERDVPVISLWNEVP